MKKIILAAALVLGFTVAASAQPKAVGIRFGYGIEASYQHNVGSANFIEANLGLEAFNALNVAATYNWMLAKPQWTDRGDWGVYAGVGAAVGLDKTLRLGVTGQAGLEYEFWFPLQLSFDLKPQLGFGFNYGFHFNIMPSLGVRYRF